jgi:glutathione S-transferase
MMQLYTNPLCPFAHRARLTLAEKGIDAVHVEIDLRRKPAEFVALTPPGAVPVLKVGDTALWESAVIAEYLEESHPEPALLPRDAVQRARARIWIRFADNRLYANTSALLHARDSSTRAAAMTRIHDDLTFMERECFARADYRRPYWLGAQFTLVDTTFYPWFEQCAALEYLFGLAWPEECVELARWRERVAARPTVREQSKPTAYYLERYAALAQIN